MSIGTFGQLSAQSVPLWSCLTCRNNQFPTTRDIQCIVANQCDNLHTTRHTRHNLTCAGAFLMLFDFLEQEAAAGAFVVFIDRFLLFAGAVMLI